MINDIVFPFILSSVIFLVGYVISIFISKDLAKRRINAEDKLLENPQINKQIPEEDMQKFKDIQDKFYKKRKRDELLAKILFYATLVSTILLLFLYILNMFIFFIDKDVISNFYMYSILLFSMVAVQYIANIPKKTSSNTA